jgi:ABC-type sugar transport system ATPase subunit
MVPEDRKKDGIVPLMAVGKNITLAALDQFSHRLIACCSCASSRVESRWLN